MYFDNDQPTKQLRLNSCMIKIGFDIIIFILTMIIQQTQNLSHTCTLYLLGSKHTPSIKYELELYRLFNPIFLHASVNHLLCNTLGHLLLCNQFENQYGTKEFLILYFSAGLFGNITSAYYNIYGTSVGASGAIFGIIGFYSASMIHIKPTKAQITNFLIIVTISALQILDPDSHVDVSAHFGGFIIGALFALTQYKIWQGYSIFQ
ncbi:Rho1-Guanine Exchange Factor-like protein [Paramecium bursaria]